MARSRRRLTQAIALGRLHELKKAHPKRGFRLAHDIEYRGKAGKPYYLGTWIQIRIFKRGCRGKARYRDYEYFELQ
jgi:hypothetical protein